MIGKDPVRTQDDLVAALGRVGIPVTQATISRDIKELGLIKVTGRNGLSRYAAAPKRDAARERLLKVVRQSVLSVAATQNLVVVQTVPSAADATGDALFGLGFENVLGVFPHGRNVLLVAKDEASANAIGQELRKFCE